MKILRGSLIGALAASVALTLSPAPTMAAAQFTLWDPTNSFTPVIDDLGLHIVCDSGCSSSIIGYATSANQVTANGFLATIAGAVGNSIPAGTNNIGSVYSVGQTSNASSGVATSAVNIPTVSYNFGFNGTTWDQLQVDGSKFLKINCEVGCAGGSSSNATSGVATSSTNGQTLGFAYWFNGTSWDQAQDDASKNLKVNVAAGSIQTTNWPSTVSVGAGVTGTSSPRVTVAQDTTTVAGSPSIPAGTNLIGKAGFDETTPGTTNAVQAQGSANTGFTQGTGAAGASSLNAFIGGAVAAIHLSTNIDQIGGAALALGAATSAGSMPVVIASDQAAVAVKGGAANNASPVGNPQQMSGQAANAEPATLATNGQNAVPITDLVHRLIVYPWTNKENEVTSGAVVLTASTASTSAIGVPGSGLYNYVTDIECFNSGASATTILVQNGNGGATIWEGYAAASGGGFAKTFATPIGGINHMTANTAVYIQAGSSTSSLICNLQGFKGS